MAAAIVPRPPWCLTPDAAAYDNQPTFWATVVCGCTGSGAPWWPLSAFLITTRWHTLLCCCEPVFARLISLQTHTHQPWQPASEPSSQQPPHQFGCFFVSAYLLHHGGMMCDGGGSKLRGIEPGDEVSYTMWFGASISDGGQQFPWGPTPNFQATKISQHTMQQVSIVKTRKKLSLLMFIG